MTPRIVCDSRDWLLLPSRGWLMQAKPDNGIRDDNYVRPSFDISQYTTMYKTKAGGKHILSRHEHAEAVEETFASGDVPPFLRLYGGGIDSIRGFQYRSITPLERGF